MHTSPRQATRPRSFPRRQRSPLRWAVLLLAATATHAANECSYRVEHGTPAQTFRKTLSVGEVDRTALTRLLRVHNHGVHDLRLSFDGAPPRQLPGGLAEPGSGAFQPGVALRSVECLATRSKGGP